MKTAMKGLLALALTAMWMGTAGAVTINSSAVSTLDLARLEHGLHADFYDLNKNNYASVKGDAAAFMNSTRPTASFISTLLDYPSGGANTVADSTKLTTFLGTDAASLTGNGNVNLEYSLFHFYGYINILNSFDTNAKTPFVDVNFAISSDDGVFLTIGEKNVINAPNERSFATTKATASFQTAGLYALDLLYFEKAGNTGIEFFSSIPGGPNSGAPTGTVGIVPTSVIYHAPEPSTVVLMGLGLAGLGIAARRRKKN